MLIRAATPDEEISFLGHRDPCIRELRCAIVDGEVVAMSGVMRDPRYHGSIFEEDGEWIGFFSVAPGARLIGWAVVAAMRQFLKEQTEPVIVQWDDQFPTAERLLLALGFQRTDRIIADFRQPSRKLRIWIWQPLPQSPHSPPPASRQWAPSSKARLNKPR